MRARLYPVSGFRSSVFLGTYITNLKNIITFEITKDTSTSCDIFQSRTADRNSSNVTLHLIIADDV